MALETLKGVKEIGGFPVEHYQYGGSGSVPGGGDILIDHEDNSISFKLQDGPIKEFGVNGCQVDTMIHAALLIIQGLNKKFPCVENEQAIAGLKQAIQCLENRKADRDRRGVEGTSKA